MKQYLDILNDIIVNGEWKENRTGVRCLTTFGQVFRHNMSDGFPLLTNRFIPFKSICGELWCFLNGKTRISDFEKAGTKFWSFGWKNPESDDPDDLGAIYSHQMRRFGEVYGDDNQGLMVGVDQIQRILDQLTRDPNDRRMLCINWCPFQLHNTALPSCHYSFYLQHINGKLNLGFTMRSWDFFLGGPANIASYALLLMLFARHANLMPNQLMGIGMDVHLYENHLDQAKELLMRESYDLPTVELTNQSFWDWTPDKTSLVGYKHGGKLTAEVAV